MSLSQVEVQGVLQTDGTLLLAERPNLPAGRVKVVIQTLDAAPDKIDPWTALEKIWAERKERGVQPRSAEEIDAEINAMRDEWEDHQQALERIQEEGRRSREEPHCGKRRSLHANESAWAWGP
ncbi:MAG TPA: hypothetical protein DDY78_21260 [Planctomycetales bacterium]|jgi:hypothetical protein|nr:hypothetical protein [Planctomycetales bacterium]